MTLQHETHVPAPQYGNLRDGPKEDGLLNNSGELDLLNKSRLSKHVAYPAPMQSEQNGAEPGRLKHLGPTFPEVMAAGASLQRTMCSSGVKLLR